MGRGLWVSLILIILILAGSAFLFLRPNTKSNSLYYPENTHSQRINVQNTSTCILSPPFRCSNFSISDTHVNFGITNELQENLNIENVTLYGCGTFSVPF